MPRTRKCHACRNSKKLCSRDGGDWNELDVQTRCSRCKIQNLPCGPGEYKDENDQGEREMMGQRASAADNRGFQPLAPAPYTEAHLRTRLRELSNSESFCTVRQNLSCLDDGLVQRFTVPEDLLHTLKDIEELAERAYASNDLSIAELTYITLIEWYDALGLEFQQPREQLLLKMGVIFEMTGWNDHAKEYSLKIFSDLLVEPQDINAPFHHAIRNFKKKGLVSQGALMRIIRCCPLCQFKLRNEQGQTPLWLAVSINEQEVVFAMIKRLRDPQRQFLIDPIILDSKDHAQLNILTTAVIAGCSLPLIDALIKCGFDVNYSTLPDGPLTPLQAASAPGYERADVAWLLLRHQANPIDIHPESTIAILLANGLLLEPAYVPILPELNQ